MSAEGPESIPTSADPRSRRPTKKRALTPTSAQAASVDALFAKPDQQIRLPPSASSSSSLTPASAARRPPPEIVTNVQGSSAGAGSGEFHVYKAARRREYERLRDMDEQVRLERDQVDFDKEKAEKLRRDEEKTRKNREKREKAKARKGKKGKGGGEGGGNGGGVKTSSSASSSSSSSAAATAQSDGVPRDNNKQKNQDGGRDKVDNHEKPSTASAEPAVGLVIHDDD